MSFPRSEHVHLSRYASDGRIIKASDNGGGQLKSAAAPESYAICTKNRVIHLSYSSFFSFLSSWEKKRSLRKLKISYNQSLLSLPD